MDTLLQSLSSEFNKRYFPKINALYKEKTKQWNYYFGTEPVESFYRGLMYVINQFLEDQDHRELFIRIPFHELGRSEKDQELNYNHLLEIVSVCLHMATSDANSRLTEVNDVCKGEWYYTNKDIKASSEKSKERKRFWEIVSTEDGGVRPKEGYPDKPYIFTNSGARNAFYCNKNNTYKLLAAPENANRNTLERLSGFADFLTKIESMKLSTQYESGLLVSCNADWRQMHMPINDKVFPDIVEHTNNFGNVIGSVYDVVIFVGDNKYKCFEQIIANMSDSRKIIYIGSDIFESFETKEKKQEAEAVHFSFTFREMFTYFNGEFPTIKTPKLESRWLTDLLNNLWNQLQTYPMLDTDERKDILTRAAFPMLSMSFKSISNTESTSLENYLYDNYGAKLTESQVSEIVTLYKGFALNRKTSKSQEYARIKTLVTSNHKELMIPSHYSYRDKLKKHVKKGNRAGNHLTIDVKGDWRGFVDVIKYMLKAGTMGTYHLLSYSELKNIRNFFADEASSYNAPYRTKILDSQEFKMANIADEAENSSTQQQVRSIGDYYHPITLEDLMKQQWNRPIDITRYSLKLEDGSEIFTSGDVIYYQNTIGIDELYEDQKECLPASITYYESPENFRDIMQTYYDFADGKDIAYYAKLWKDKLRNYCDSAYSGDVRKMRSKEFAFLPASQIANYLRDTNDTQFPLTLPALAKKLETLGLITTDEFKNLIGAYFASKTFSKLGVELKEALYNYKLFEQKSKLLTDIENNAKAKGLPITADSMADSALRTVRVMKIEELKKNNNDE